MRLERALRGIAGAFVLLALAGGGMTQEPPGEEPGLSAEEVISRSHRAFYYPGDDMKARVTMELVDRDGGKRTRVLTMLRRDEAEGGNQKYFIYFHEPGDVRRMTFMVWKYPDKDDDRWIFVPAVDLVRRVAADDKRSSFVGSDFTYEDVSGRDLGADAHTLLREEPLGDRACYVVQSVPRESADYARKLSWIDRERFLPLKEEYYDVQGELFRVFTADRIEDVAAGAGAEGPLFPTVMQRTMKNVKTAHRTEVRYASVAYNLGLEDEDFSERRMRRPPREWTE